MTEALMRVREMYFPDRELLDQCFRYVPRDRWPSYLVYCPSVNEWLLTEAVAQEVQTVRLCFCGDMEQAHLQRFHLLVDRKLAGELSAAQDEERRLMEQEFDEKDAKEVRDSSAYFRDLAWRQEKILSMLDYLAKTVGGNSGQARG